MKSMTGYGRSADSARDNSGELGEAWARSVNGRFLEIRVHLPREWAELEPEVRTLAQSILSRGTVDLHITRAKTATTRSRVEVDERMAKEWIAALEKLAKTSRKSTSKSTAKSKTKTNSDVEIPFEVLAKAPDVVRVVSDERITPIEKSKVLKVAKEALKALEKERLREGLAIRKELLSLLGMLDQVVSKVSKLADGAPDDLRARLKARMDRLEGAGLQPPTVDDSRFHQEVAILIDRGDIREEIARLSAHLKVYRELIEAKGETKDKAPAPIGKTLDFYAQELLREVNTVGSKSQTAELTRLVVEAKTCVEKIREQVQNVE